MVLARLDREAGCMAQFPSRLRRPRATAITLGVLAAAVGMLTVLGGCGVTGGGTFVLRASVPGVRQCSGWPGVSDSHWRKLLISSSARL